MTDAEIIAEIGRRYQAWWPRLLRVARTTMLCDYIRDREYKNLGIERAFKLPQWVTT